MLTHPEVLGLNYSEIKNQISTWLKQYCISSKQTGYVLGVSGGIDSAVVSTLCAMTGLPLVVISMSIHQEKNQEDRGQKHIDWLKNNFSNVTSYDVDLTSVYDSTVNTLDSNKCLESIDASQRFLTLANTRSRLRMITLYSIAGASKLLVCGTGNKVEDYGIGFFTKFGDGGVDLSPIGELTKTEVYALGKELGIIEEILSARPTDGLWDDGRTDEDQIGATYPELEWAMNVVDQTCDAVFSTTAPSFQTRKAFLDDYEVFLAEAKKNYGVFSERQLQVLDIYKQRHVANFHKMNTPPVFNIKRY